jgi:hypothetical protein
LDQNIKSLTVFGPNELHPVESGLLQRRESNHQKRPLRTRNAKKATKTMFAIEKVCELRSAIFACVNCVVFNAFLISLLCLMVIECCVGAFLVHFYAFLISDE